MNNLQDKLLILIYFLFAICFNSLSQDLPYYKSEKKFSLSLAVGPSWQSTLMNFFNFKAFRRSTFFCTPLNYERNIQGVGLSPSISLHSNQHGLGIDYSSSLRYDHIYRFSGQAEKKAFLTNHFISLTKERVRIRRGVEMKSSVGIGYGIINTSKSFRFTNTCTGKVNERFNLQFPVYDVFYRQPIRPHFFLEAKALLTAQGHPLNPESSYIFYSLRVAYNIKLVK